MPRETGIVGTRALIYTVVAAAIVVSLIILFYLYPLPISENEKEQEKFVRQISSWDIYIDGEKGKIIRAETQEDGRAIWSGNIKIVVFDQNSTPLEGVKILLDGCGILSGGHTDANGSVELSVTNVTLPSGMAQADISVSLTYIPPGENAQVFKDSITVIREY